MAFITKLIVVVAIMFLLLGCQQDFSKERMLFDFESDAELDQLHWQCHTFFSLSDEYVTHGNKSLKMELYPSEYPGFVPKLSVKNWKGYCILCFDVYNATEKSVHLGVRIDDKKDYPEHDDRYNKTFVLKKGRNHISITLETLTTTKTNRHLDLARIRRLYIFMSRPEIKTVLYLDAIKLVK